MLGEVAGARPSSKIVTRYGSCQARTDGNGCRFPEQAAHGVGSIRVITEGKSITAEVGGAIGELIQWLLSLDPSFAFLLALPFGVGFAGFLSEHLRRRRAKTISRHPKINHGSS